MARNTWKRTPDASNVVALYLEGGVQKQHDQPYQKNDKILNVKGIEQWHLKTYKV